MLKNKRGFSLTVLVVAIAVILIITTTAVISIKNINKDRDISSFMNDLADMKQFVIEYMAKDNTLPVKINSSGEMISAESVLIQSLSGEEALMQLDEEDTGEYYFIDIAKLGKIHLVDTERGYIVNEGTLNIYVTNPIEYEGTKYYTLTPYLLGKDVVVSESTPFEIVVMGNPVTWTDKAEILVSVPNVKIGEADGWNFKWLKGSKSITDFKNATTINYFTYGDVITLTENGIYTVYVENPEKKANIRKVVVSRIDDIPPTIVLDSGELIIDDAQTGIKNIRCKVKETTRFPIDDDTRKKYPEFYTMRNESYADNAETALANYLWEDEKIKGDTIENYLLDYKEYYEQLMKYNNIILSASSTSGEIENASSAIELLNDSYPQFAYNNQTFTNSEMNLVIYVEDIYGNATVHSAISRNELAAWQYTNDAGLTLLDSSVVINDNDLYTNNREVLLFLQSIHAKYFFVTEETTPTAIWSEFESNSKTFTISSGDGEKIVYVFYKDANGKIASAYDKINLDETYPSTDAPTVSYGSTGISIIANQTDTNIVGGIETQSGLNGLFRYGIKKSGGTSYTWYERIASIPKLEEGQTYYVVTQATDKAGNTQISNETTLVVPTNELAATLDIGDYVDYTPDIRTYATNTNNTGSSSAQSLTTENVNWRVLSIDEDTGEVLLTTDGIVNDGIGLSGTKAYFRGAKELNTICANLYSDSSLGITARSMTIEDLNKACGYTPSATLTRYAYYPSGNSVSGTIDYNGNTYTRIAHAYDNARFYTSDGGMVVKTDENGFTYRTPENDKPVYVTQTYYNYAPSDYDATVGEILGDENGWLASTCVHTTTSNVGFNIRSANADSVDSGCSHTSDITTTEGQLGIRPVIVLDANFQVDVSDTTKDGSTSDKAWVLTKD